MLKNLIFVISCLMPALPAYGDLIFLADLRVVLTIDPKVAGWSTEGDRFLVFDHPALGFK